MSDLHPCWNEVLVTHRKYSLRFAGTFFQEARLVSRDLTAKGGSFARVFSWCFDHDAGGDLTGVLLVGAVSTGAIKSG